MLDNPFIGRIVVFIAPVIAALTAVVVNAFQDWFGIELDGAQLSVLLTGAVVGVLGLAYKWLDNRGKYEQILEQVESGAFGPPVLEPAMAEELDVPPDAGPVEAVPEPAPPEPENRRGA